MDYYYPVVVVHYFNQFFKARSDFILQRQLAVAILQDTIQVHVCHRKRHLICHLWHLGCVWRVFIPFDTLCSNPKRPRLHASH